MGRRSRTVPRTDPAEQQIREQEVLRANKELAAYFKGRRTEREARAALKIIKAFIRYRERTSLANRRPLPGAESPKPAKNAARKKPRPAETAGGRPRRQLSRAPSPDTQESPAASKPVALFSPAERDEANSSS